MGGMAAQIPIKGDPEANDRALAKVREDKLREVRAGHDGTWVAHPGLVPVAKAIFDEHMKGQNQLGCLREEVRVNAADLLKLPEGEITQKGLELNIDVGIQYLEAWLRGNGAVAIYNLMEDAATAEISRAQLWQWAQHGARMSDGRTLSVDAVTGTIPAVLDGLRTRIGAAVFDSGKYNLAAQLFEHLTRSETFPEFLTLAAYEHID